MRIFFHKLLVILLLAFTAVIIFHDSAASTTASSAKVLVLHIQSPISPATELYLDRAFNKAALDKASLMIIELDTPGGLDDSMRKMIRQILESPIPVVVYVAPKGARAASAGTYLLYASHIAAMAPGTHLGAATPVALGGETPVSAPSPSSKTQTVETSKRLNDAIAYIRALAILRHRNPDWAQQAVKQASTLTADEALQKHVIDIKAENIPDLLKQLDGRSIRINNQDIRISTQTVQIEDFPPSLAMRLLSAITDPNIAYILLLLGFYGLFFELMNPGFVAPGIIGAICLLTAFYGLSLLPITWAGTMLILLGLLLVFAEFFVTSGILALGGILALALGALLLFNLDSGYAISIEIITATALLNACFFLWLVYMALRARSQPALMGAQAMVGQTARVVDDFSDVGWVMLNGERWQAKTFSPLKKNQIVMVTEVSGKFLWVRLE